MGKLFKKLQSKHKKGFTLFEVLIVVIILGTLAVIAIPTYNKLIRKSRVADGLHVLDMLVNAQDKYYIEHGYYAENITSLNAPFKETRRVDPSNPFVDIVTTNFTYTKNFRKNCIEARSNIGGNYTLVKNFQKRDKVICMGNDCANVEDYVDAIGEDAYGQLCPDENQCTKDQQWCANNQPGTHFFWMSCSCACNHNDYLACIQGGGTYHQSDCSCHEPEPCKPEDNYSGYGANCNYTGVIPEYSNGSGKPNSLEGIIKETKGGTKGDRGTNPGNDQPQKYTCGIYYDTHICNEGTGEWQDTHECVYKANYCENLGPGYVLNTRTCECVRQCSQSIPHGVNDICGVPLHPIQVCDPCHESQNQVVEPEIPGRGASPKGSPKGDVGNGVQNQVQEHCCGYRATGGESVECNYETGEWECVSSNTCTRVDSEEIGQPCDGDGTAGNQCGIQAYLGCRLNDSFSGVEVLTYCVLNTAAGNECFDGQTKECTIPGTNETGVEHCVDCKWDHHCAQGNCGAPDACTPGETQPCPENPALTQTCNDNCEWGQCGPNTQNCEGIPDTLGIVPWNGTSQCYMYQHVCVQGQDGTWQWAIDENVVVPIQEPAPGEEVCETGWVRECSDPTENCDLGQGRGGNGGGRGAGLPCCDMVCQHTCRTETCMPHGQIPPGFDTEACVVQCIENNGGFCQGGGGGGGNSGGGTGGGCTPPAQGCYTGWHWNPVSCECVKNDPGNPPEPPTYGRPTQICQNCRWSCCSHCDFNDLPTNYPGYTSSCAFYKTTCYHDPEDPEATAWLDGQDWYNLCKSNTYTNCEYAQWFGDNECENGRNRTCNGGTGRQYCNSCHWGDCNPLPHHVSNVQIIATTNGLYKLCPDGVVVDNYSGNTCDGSEYGCDVSDMEMAWCRNNNAQNISRCNLGGSNYETYCRNHPGTRCIIDAVTFCEISGGLVCCPGWESSCGNAFGNCTETYDCAHDVRLLECD